MDYKSGKHCKYLILYHIILVCKYRRKLLVKTGEDIKSIIQDVSLKYGFTVETMEVDKDHLHMLISTTPEQSPKSLVTLIKKITTYRIWRLNLETVTFLRKYIRRKHMFWSDGSFICTI